MPEVRVVEVKRDKKDGQPIWAELEIIVLINLTNPSCLDPSCLEDAQKAELKYRGIFISNGLEVKRVIFKNDQWLPDEIYSLMLRRAYGIFRKRKLSV